MRYLKNKKAFSLIELSIVLLIIGVIVAGITQSSRLIRQFKLSSARSQTQSSPAISINGMVLWLDSTAVASFAESETEDAATSPSAYISNWYDISPSAISRIRAYSNSSAARPQRYENCMNALPCVRFDGSASFLVVNPKPSISDSDYTIFVVEQRRSAASAQYFIGGTAMGSPERRLTLGYRDSTTIRFDQGAVSDTNYYAVTVADYSTPTVTLHTFMNGYGYYINGVVYRSGIKSYYQNGSSTQVNTDPSNPSKFVTVGTPTNANIEPAWTMLLGRNIIGAGGSNTFYNGDLGEIIIYNRALKNEERINIESYLLKKWSIKKAA